MRKLLVTGAAGLIGSEVCTHFSKLGWEIHGVENNQRAVFFGPNGDTRWNLSRLAAEIGHFVHHELDIRDRMPLCTLPRNPAMTVLPLYRSMILIPTP
jgi:CDP-paratose 2-epimerase